MQAAPSYTAVEARQTLPRPPVPVAKPQPQKVSWSPAVRAYVQRAFEPDNAIPGIAAPEMQERLKSLITAAAESGGIDSIDWTRYPLPQAIIKAEREQVALLSHPTNLISTTPSLLTSMASSPDSANRKRKNGDLEVFASEELATTPPWKRKDNRPMEDRMSGKPTKSQSKKQKKADVLRVNGFDANADILEKRKQRFGYATPEPSPYLSSRDESPDAAAGPLVGTCQTVEKSYFRLTAPPAPDVVRPQPVLEKALAHIREKWKKEHNYTYACDQLKSLRQDLTVQHIKNELTVKVYECHARIALEMTDLGEYNQCQTQLRALYKAGIKGKAEEFMAYRILYIIYTCNRTDMNDVLADLTSADKKAASVAHALKVRSALASGNYHRFFRLWHETPNMGGYLLDLLLQRERLAATATICRA